MQTQTKLSMDLLKTSLDYSARVQGQQMKMLTELMAVQMRLGMAFWTSVWPYILRSWRERPSRN
jgi:hypothetical protein